MPYAVRTVRCTVCDTELTGRYPPKGPYLCMDHFIAKMLAWSMYMHTEGPRWSRSWVRRERAKLR